jgi:hypothetical protein
MVKAGPDAQEHADNIGQLLSNLEYNRMRAVLKVEELRTIYELDCAELGLVATVPDLSELLKGIEEERKRRPRLTTAFIMGRFEERASVFNLEEAIRRKKYSLTYKVAAKEEDDDENIARERKEEPGVRSPGNVESVFGAEQPSAGRAPADCDLGRDGEDRAAPGADPGPLQG